MEAGGLGRARGGLLSKPFKPYLASLGQVCGMGGAALSFADMEIATHPVEQSVG